MKKIIDYILHRRIAPKGFQCSACGAYVERGRVYTKTNWGRFCASCGEGISPVPSYVLSQ